jgi:3-deoxy-D-manno-octulosonate 8-phosphate phosphatase (KDO 8-P phosphatase)
MKKIGTALRNRLRKIKMLLLDVDGVLTDGSIILDNKGNEVKAFHVRDGHGIKMAQRAGVTIGIITGRKSRVVTIRAKELGIREVYQGQHKKIEVYEKLLAKYKLNDAEVAYMGDDIVDLDIFKRAGIAVTVADCDPSVRKDVHLITDAAGGRGAVREFINLLLASKDAGSSA